ncbi:hypothetical protein BDM02DRAFT_3133526 [Thelephora ganbajun]|uniref:Uncharacterized protein n=1 Tax=Thelephora ganbajun TaxID=370292 RepID=A0ACB6YX59_THEGA|nr:hypothetical protein BDM02DRAFT_3133526 [Thelephora ganbajun]
MCGARKTKVGNGWYEVGGLWHFRAFHDLIVLSSTAPGPEGGVINILQSAVPARKGGTINGSEPRDFRWVKASHLKVDTKRMEMEAMTSEGCEPLGCDTGGSLARYLAQAKDFQLGHDSCQVGDGEFDDEFFQLREWKERAIVWPPWA